MIKRKLAVGIILLLLVTSVAANGYYYHKYRQAQAANPTVQMQDILSELRKTTAVPNEAPSVITVVDHTKLSNTLLAEKSANGDMILVFQKANKVIIYRPSSHKIIDILSLKPAQ